MGSQLIIRDVRGIRVVAIVGPFDALNAAELAQALHRAADGQQFLVVSLEQCSHVDIEAVAVLMLLHRRLGSALAIASAHHRVFEITGVDDIVLVAPSLDEAVRRLMRSVNTAGT